MRLNSKVSFFGVMLLLSCTGSERSAKNHVELVAWFHTGRQAERRTIEQQVQRFHATQDSVRIRLIMLPEGSYNGQLQAAAVAGDLPDVFELDGPYVARAGWQGRLHPLGTLLPDSLLSSLLPSIRAQGSWRDELYAVGTFDSGLALYARRNQLESLGIRLPRAPHDAWSLEEFERILEELAASDEDGAVLDLKLSLRGEWISYAFMPLLHSAGGSVLGIDRQRQWRAAGALDSPASIRALEAVQRWVRSGRVDPDLDNAAFVQGRVALAWGGHWDFTRYHEAWGDDLLILPLPDLGEGTRTGQGSWCWAINAESPHPELAARFLQHLLGEDEIIAMCKSNGAVPARRGAASRMAEFSAGGVRRLFLEQLSGGYAVPRPRTPAYPVITSAFQRAFGEIRDGAPVIEALGRAARDIDRELKDIGERS
jgi:multiple sugar transport system substrate-binding protein